MYAGLTHSSSNVSCHAYKNNTHVSSQLKELFVILGKCERSTSLTSLGKCGLRKTAGSLWRGGRPNGGP